MKKIFMMIFLIFFCLGYSAVFGQIDSQWRGPNRGGVYPNENLLKEWPDEGPKLIWSVEGLGEGYSSPAVTSDRVYLTGMIRGEGFLFAFDMGGKLVWRASYGPEWDGSRPGARTSPTVVGDRIYLMSAKGQAVCFSTDGKKIWSVNLMEEFGARNIEWGMTESLLVDGDHVFCTPGGRDVMIAKLDRYSGKTIWEIKGNGETSGYCSPRLVKHGERRLLLTMTAKSVVGIDADTGEYLWRHSHVTDYNVHANTPLYHNGYLYTVSGYDTGGQMFKLSEDGKGVRRVWSQETLDSQMGAVVLVDGYIYGSGHQNRGWHCLEWKTGKVRYTAREIGNKGAIIFSDGMMYCYSERGDVALVKPNPQKFEVVSSFQIKKGSGEHWAHPVVKDGRLYIRHGDALMVYHIAK
ncbi:MAG: PQQ-binding-like beta-propeller repeat protein [Candidatus Aminicenantes bacterium]|nr:PQQ-binding-like beta-propeller repeat protein [Candidatus Aminicenantes bacterium]